MATVSRINAEINLQDNLSGPLKEAGANIRKFADRSKNEIGQFTGGAKKAWKDFGDQLGQMSQKVQMAGVAMTAGLTAPILLLGKQALDTAVRFDSLNRGIMAVDGGANGLKETLKGLDEIAKLPGLGLEEVRQGYINLRAAGIEAGLAKDAMMGFGNALATVGRGKDDMDGVMRALTQISAKGKVSAEEINQLAERVPQIREVMKSAFGTANTEVLQKAGIDSQTFIAKIVENLKTIPRVTGGIRNDLENFSDTWKKALAEIGKAMIPFVKQLAEVLVPMMEKFTATLAAMTPQQKKAALGLTALAAAAGPMLVTLGSIGNAIGGLLTGWGSLGKLLEAGGAAFTKAGGAIGILRSALAFLTGPVGIAIALATALYVAWKNNFLNIQGIVMPFAKRIWGYFQDMYTNVATTMRDLWTVIVGWWKSIYPSVKPILDFLVGYIQDRWKENLRAIEAIFRFIMDVINAAMAGIAVISGKGWDKISNSMRASLLRLQSLVISAFTEIVQFALEFVKGLTDVFSYLPGAAGDAYDGMIQGAQDWINSIKAEGIAMDWLADKYQKMADKERPNPFGKFKSPTVEAMEQPRGAPTTMEIHPKGKKGKKDDTAEKEAERIRNAWDEVYQILRQLNAEKMRARGEDLKDVLAMQEYGKRFNQIQTDKIGMAHRAKIEAMAETEQYHLQIEAQEKLAQALKEKQDAYKALNKEVWSAGDAMGKEREQLYFTTNEEKARWEITKGGYKDASALAQAYYVIQAALLDKAEQSKRSAEAWKKFWADLFAKAKEMREEQAKSAKGKYEEYLKKITERLLQLKGAQEEVIRADLREQFKGLEITAEMAARGIKSVDDAIDEVVKGNKEVDQMEDRIKMIQDYAKKIEDIFNRALDDLFENGFKGFFNNVIGGFRNLVQEIAKEMIKLQMKRALIWGIGQLFGAGAKADVEGTAASGGSVWGGSPYLVGETGPEVFIPSTPGRIIPNYAGSSGSGTIPSMAGGGGGTVINVNLQADSPNAFRKSEGQMIAEVFARASRARARNGRG
jgi:tape measure domain-containing protein